jgi:hypothetical protein
MLPRETKPKTKAKAKKTKPETEPPAIEEPDGLILDGPDLISGDDQQDVPSLSPSSNPWGDSERKEDEFTGRDGESRRSILTLAIPNDKDSPGYGMLCLDKKNFTLAPEELFDCVILDRIMPNIAQLPFNESKNKPAWECITGYSFNGLNPSPWPNGNFCEDCLNTDGVPYFQCSIDPPFDRDDPTPLATESGIIPGTKIKGVGECLWARWARTLQPKVRKAYGIKNADAKPYCDKHIIFIGWHQKYEALFVSYFKRTSYPSARAFLGSCNRGMGDNAKSLPFHNFIAQISVQKKGTYFIPKIVNTGGWSDPTLMKPVVEFFNENRKKFVRNLLVTYSELMKKDKDVMDFPPKN